MTDRTKGFIGLVVVAAVIGGAVSSCGDSSASKSSSSEPSLEQLIATDPATPTICEGYFSLVNRGWNNDSIYDELNAGGAFEGYLGNSGRTYFDALVKYCYQNN